MGIGTDFDKILIERCGKLGKGTSSFVEDVKNINSVVINTLNKCLRSYITDIKFEFGNYKEEILHKIIGVNPINNFTYQNEVMNYSFILPNNKELSNLKVKITGKDPINIIESNINVDNIIKIENGEEMGKMIIGKALKNNDELIKDEKKEIEFAKKYQILSKNTALFAEILNEENQQSKLIKVNLNEYKNEIPKFRPMIYANFAMARPKRMKMDKFAALRMMAKKMDNYDMEERLQGRKENINISSPPTSGIKDNVTRIIMGQDIIEGFWEENEETKRIINIISLDKFNKIVANVNSVYKGDNEKKLIYTILVIYYLKSNCSERLDEFRLIINKANKYLEKNGIKYENIISNI